MPIDWSKEPFACLFKRATDEDHMLSWEARAVWHAFLWKCDEGGVVEARRGVRGFAVVLEIPVDIVEGALSQLLEDGRLREQPGRGFIAPNYVAAKRDALTSIMAQGKHEAERDAAAARQRRSRRAKTERDVTKSDDSVHQKPLDFVTSQVTDHDSSDLGSSASSFPDPLKQSGEDLVTPSRRRRIPETWRPREQERQKARELGLNCEEEAREFLSYWLGDGRTKADWDRTFLNRLYQQAKRRPRYGAGTGFDAVMRIARGEDQR